MHSLAESTSYDRGVIGIGNAFPYLPSPRQPALSLGGVSGDSPTGHLMYIRAARTTEFVRHTTFGTGASGRPLHWPVDA